MAKLRRRALQKAAERDPEYKKLFLAEKEKEKNRLEKDLKKGLSSSSEEKDAGERESKVS